MKSIFHAAAFPAEREKRTEKNKTEIRQFVQITQVSPSIYFIKKQQQKEGETVRATPFKLRLSKVATPFTLTFLSLSLTLCLSLSVDYHSTLFAFRRQIGRKNIFNLIKTHNKKHQTKQKHKIHILDTPPTALHSSLCTPLCLSVPC